MLNNLTNFLSIFTKGRLKKTLNDSDIIPIGTRDPKFGGGYKPTAARFDLIKNKILESVPSNGSNEVSIKLREHPIEQEQQYYDITENVAKEYWQKGAEELFTSNIPHVKLDNGNLAAMYYVQFIMPDGTLVFEAYDIEEDHNPGTGNNGYWIAMKPNLQGRLEKVSQLEMSDVFWDYWYDWSVKLPDNQIALVWSNSVFNSSRSLESSKVVIKYSDANGLELVSEQYSDYGGATVGSVLNGYYGIAGPYNAQRAEPEFLGNNSYYEMINGPDNGWVFFSQTGDYIRVAAFNVLTFEVKKYEIGVDTPSPTNTNGPIFNQDYFSLGVGFTMLCGNGGFLDNASDNGLTGLWAPGVGNGTTVTWLKSRWPAILQLRYFHTEAVINFNTKYGFCGDGYFYDIYVHSDGRVNNGQIAKLTRQKIGENVDPEVSYVMLPKYKDPGFTFAEPWSALNMGVYPFAKGIAFLPFYDQRQDAAFGALDMIVWTTDNADAVVLQSSQSAPSEWTGDKIIGKDIINLTARLNHVYPVLVETYKDFNF